MKKRPFIIYNEDGQGTLEASLEDPVGSLRDWVDRVLDNIKLDAFAVSLATPDLVKYKSEVGQVKWSKYWQGKDEVIKTLKWWQQHGIKVYRKMFELETDPLEIYAGRVHERGLPFIAEVRMGDTHHQKIDPDFPGCSQFLVDHPEWVIKRDDPLPAGAVETAMDYSYPGVREHRLAIIKELVNKPQVDGLELNFNRHLKYFRMEEAPHKLDIMTEFLGQVRGFLDQVSRKRKLAERMPLGVRVPPTLKECRLVGLDPVSWLRRGYLDYVILGEFEHNDPQIPVEQFVHAARGTDCSILIQMADTIGGLWRGKPSMKDRNRGLALFRDCYNGLLNTDAEARATAYNAYAWGADGVGFWNICCNMGEYAKHGGPEQRQRMLSWMNCVTSPQKVLAGPRHYHFLPMCKRSEYSYKAWRFIKQGYTLTGVKNCRILRFNQENLCQRQVYDFRMADGRDGKPLKGSLRFEIFHIGPADDVAVDINGVEIAAEKIRRDHQPQADPPTTWFEISLPDCPPFCGFNELGLTAVRLGQKDEEPYLEELEVMVEA